MDRVYAAYAVSRKSGQTVYVAKVKIYNTIAGKFGYLQSFTGLGDTREEAENSAVEHMKDYYGRIGASCPDAKMLGKMPLAALDHPYFFGKVS